MNSKNIFNFSFHPWFSTAGIHGNELVGRELILLLARHLCLGYTAQEKGVTHLVDNTRIFLIPLLNPDGAEVAVEGSCTSQIGQNNTNGVDLVLDFPGRLLLLLLLLLLFLVLFLLSFARCFCFIKPLFINPLSGKRVTIFL